jgi:hypothetical protein
MRTVGSRRRFTRLAGGRVLCGCLSHYPLDAKRVDRDAFPLKHGQRSRLRQRATLGGKPVKDIKSPQTSVIQQVVNVVG